ncbi:protein of unknown function [Desulfacinum hydrothermale DSM 13146]|uniref:DUF3786 domain-containing protein n=1 Tax=Desulfacinum hydrothermale DSM 13146 TaxID=1121390 RepID=A0A1W1WYS1_9BACT|nr:DUF3786 domain-containing protein [Desulfacinum hydrothermale]SMC16815.1 protein of unknown function [Desulfacinum hydrothermale DSM 13146]
MEAGYEGIVKGYLEKAWARGAEELLEALPAQRSAEGGLHLRAFGAECTVHPDRIVLGGRPEAGVKGVLTAIYCAFVPTGRAPLEPLVAFKEIPNSGPYQAAFAAKAENLLVPHVAKIHEERASIMEMFSGHLNPQAPAGDFSFTLYPLPKIPLYYIFHLPDEEFPAAVTCLFGGAAHSFMPLDALADVAEYTGRTVLERLRAA